MKVRSDDLAPGTLNSIFKQAHVQKPSGRKESK